MAYKQQTFPEFVGATFFRTLGHDGNILAVIRDSVKVMVEQLGEAAMGVDIQLPLSLSDRKTAIQTAMLGIIYPKSKSENEFDDFCLFMMAIEMVRTEMFDERTVMNAFNELSVYPFDYSGSPESTANYAINRVTWTRFETVVSGMSTLRDKASEVIETVPNVVVECFKHNIQSLSQAYGSTATTKSCTPESSKQDIQAVYQCRVTAFQLIWHYQTMLAFQDVLSDIEIAGFSFSMSGV